MNEGASHAGCGCGNDDATLFTNKLNVRQYIRMLLRLSCSVCCYRIPAFIYVLVRHRTEPAINLRYFTVTKVDFFDNSDQTLELT